VFGGGFSIYGVPCVGFLWGLENSGYFYDACCLVG